jgi:hypothetical protein
MTIKDVDCVNCGCSFKVASRPRTIRNHKKGKLYTYEVEMWTCRTTPTPPQRNVKRLKPVCIDCDEKWADKVYFHVIPETKVRKCRRCGEATANYFNCSSCHRLLGTDNTSYVEYGQRGA